MTTRKQKTSEILIDCIKNNKHPPGIVLHDYFGKNFMNQFNYSILYRIYRDLYILGVNESTLHFMYLENKLDNFVHNKFKETNLDNRNYKLFCEYKIVIGKTFIED